MKKFDILIVGSGLFGSVFAYEANKIGKKCLVLERRDHLGGNIYCENIENINVHKYGAHIFHTNDKAIWDYVNQFATFNNFINSPVAISKGKLYNLPFNMNTFYQLWGVISPEEAKQKIQDQIVQYGTKLPRNLEEQALSLVGKDVYETLIKEYTEKQWGVKAYDLPSFIIKRLPVRFTYNNNYFNDKYQGIPEGGYNGIIEKLLKDVEVRLNTNFFDDRVYFESLANNIVFTGKIDEYFDYEFGELEYRSLRFDNQILDSTNFQGNAVVNYIDKEYEFTRIIEHKHFEFGKQSKTVITKEYPQEWNSKREAYYPINNDRNQLIYAKYEKKSKTVKNVIFGGRLAEYKYYDMHQIIASALSKFKNEYLSKI